MNRSTSDSRDILGPARRTLSASLRQATKATHERLESLLPLMSPSLTLGRYRALLEDFYGFYAPLEPTLAALYRAHAGPSSGEGRAKVPRLRRDLRALGASDGDIESIPLCQRLPVIATLASALGGMYVFEGATLGGRFIVRALREHLGLDVTRGASFFDGYGAETGAMWRSFVTELDASPEPDGAETVAAATATFQAFEGWLLAASARYS